MSSDPHHPVWMEHRPSTAAPPLQRDLDVDVAVIGAGITGLTAALLLQREGLSVAVLERHRIARGATGHTSGHLTASLDVSYRTLAQRFGRDGARAMADASVAAIDAIGRLAVEVGVDAGFQHVPGYRYGLRREDLDELTLEAELTRELGLQTSLVYETPLPFATVGALRYENQAIVQPMHYAAGLARAFATAGGLLFEDTAVLELEDGEPCRLKTRDHAVRARWVIEATHSPVLRVLTVQTRLGPYMTYVLTARLAGAAPVALCWDMEDPYHYFRPLAAGSDRLIAGGCDHKTGQPEAGVDPFLKLEEHVRRHFDVVDIERRWSYEVFEPADGLPYVGQGGGDHVLIATGYAGTGLTFGTMAAHLLADRITGRRNPLAELLSPGRVKPLASAKEVLRENANVAWRMVRDRLARPGDADAATIAPGAGRLVEVDGHRAAAYRDAQGTLHVMSPVCTHMGCIVHWNDSAATWDCPCHGGRYLPTGDVLCSPPIRGLQQHD